ncbi:MAG TPA: SCO family protein [Fredinandcohnia sp.]|nr:SCO family protein [Fredinandcohnia sp.]
MKASRIVTVVGAAAIAVLAAAWLTLQGLGARASALPELFPMPDFRLVNEQGTVFGSADLRGKVVVANFIFTRCPTVCPGLTARMARLQKEIPADLPIHFVSFSVDPRHDTPEVLREYGKQYDQDPARWTFLTGELGAVLEAVEKGFRIGVSGAEDPDASPFDIVHGEHFVLVDPAGTIRGYYPNEEAALQRLVRDAQRLAGEG